MKTKFKLITIVLLINLGCSFSLSYFFITPQGPMLQLGYSPYDLTGLMGRSITEPQFKIHNDILHLSFLERNHVKFYTSDDFGSTWNFISDVAEYLNTRMVSVDLDVFSEKELVLTYNDNPSYISESSEYFVTFSHDGGFNWDSPLNLTQNRLMPIISYINSTCLITAYYEQAIEKTIMNITFDTAKNWNPQYSSLDLGVPIQLSYHQNNSLYLLSFGFYAYSGHNVLFKSIDLGKTWLFQSYLPYTTYHLRSSAFSFDSHNNLIIAYINETSNYIHLIKSMDDGITWQEVNTPKLNHSFPIRLNYMLMDISADDDIFIGYLRSYFQIIPMTLTTGLDYFWIEKDIWFSVLPFWLIIFCFIFFLIGIAIIFTCYYIIKQRRRRKNQ